jgi:hypothetical protein
MNDALPICRDSDLRHDFAGEGRIVCHAGIIAAASATLAAKSTAVAANDDAASVWGRLPLLRWLTRLVYPGAHAVGFYPKDGGKFAYGGPVHAPLSDDDLRQHLSNKRPIAVYPIAPGADTARVGVLDVDNKRGAPLERVIAVALRIVEAAAALDVVLAPALSGGGAGLHLWCHFETPQKAADVRAHLRKILERAGFVLKSDSHTAPDAHGIEVEVFPKQDNVPENGHASLIALPFSRLSVPLDEDMRPIAEPLPWYGSPPVPTDEGDGSTAKIKDQAEQIPASLALVREALAFLSAAPHWQWIEVGLALKHSFGEPGYALWLAWSKTCPDKFKEVEDPRKIWDGFRPRANRPITVGSIYFRAMLAGWPGPHAYEERPDGIYWVKPTEDGPPTRIKLSNFTVKIVEDITVDSGTDHLEREVVVEHKDGRATIPSKDFDALGWVMPVLGAKAIVTPESRLRGHLVAAIKHLSRPDKRTIYSHLGWRRLNDKWLYLHSHGALGADGPVEGIDVRTDAGLSAYRLPAVHDNKPPAILASLSLVELCPNIMWPLLGAVYRAPLGEWCPITTSLLLTGATGVGKTTAAMLGQAHYGIFTRVPADWSSTANALELKCFVTKDAVLLIDDFVAKATRGDVQQLLAKAERVFRGAANRSGRGRLTQ